MEYIYVKKEELKENVKNLLYPRESFLLEENNVYESILSYCLNILNSLVYSVRSIELFKQNNSVDLEFNEALISSVYAGTKVGKVVNIFSTVFNYNFFNVWKLRFASNPNFLVNLVRYNQDFREFVFSFNLYNQLRQRMSNTNIDWTVVKQGEDVYKIILGQSFENIDRINVIFLPYFENRRIKKYDDKGKIISVDVDGWLFTNKEYNFLSRYMIGYIMYKEGLTLSELDITGSTTNKDTLITEGKDIIEKAVTEFKSFHSNCIARRL